MLSARSNSLPSIVRQSWPCVPSLFCQLNLLLSGTEPSYFTPNPSGGSPFMSESIWRQKLLPGKRKSACGPLCSRPCCSPRSPVHLPRSLFPAQAGNFAPASAVRTAQPLLSQLDRAYRFWSLLLGAGGWEFSTLGRKFFIGPKLIAAQCFAASNPSFACFFERTCDRSGDPPHNRGVSGNRP